MSEQNSEIQELRESLAEQQERIEELENRLGEAEPEENSGISRRAALGGLGGLGLLGVGAGGLFATEAKAATGSGYWEGGELRDANGNAHALLQNGGPTEFQYPVTAPSIDTGRVKIDGPTPGNTLLAVEAFNNDDQGWGNSGQVTESVGTARAVILNTQQSKITRAGVLFVYGVDTTDPQVEWLDEVTYVNGGGTVTRTILQNGAPPGRNFFFNAGDIELVMDSGSFDVVCQALALDPVAE